MIASLPLKNKYILMKTRRTVVSCGEALEKEKGA